jgi:hypothetical protein
MQMTMRNNFSDKELRVAMSMDIIMANDLFPDGANQNGGVAMAHGW